LPATLKVGEERPIIFLSDALGITLNRGSDGVVRVMSVVPDNPGSSIVRTGYIEVGDVIREAAGVDIRRPITNIMWGDTVALIKMAPRPITLIVARELSAITVSVHEERDRFRSPVERSPVSSPTYKRPYTIAEI
jgi:C-terminal processing protease CtpA/Prc